MNTVRVFYDTAGTGYNTPVSLAAIDESGNLLTLGHFGGTAGAAAPATAYGSGGAGAATTTTQQAGGAGAGGLIRIWEFA